ncbi:hypothetical protein FA13DRAFT_1730317 [Coprinellus micaceus]|uniref:Uncharacterized protein n=1 Tax=Coprinellus micaceus TaxID=71717 RepID=A0A4Y7TKD5_COPMI|nr:hypothetical protein FA13DRAFT_1730317 [Coprinellus micaceus]
MPTAEHDRALATVEDGLFIFLDDSKVNDFVVAEGTPGQWKWVVNRDGRWAGGTETVFADRGPDDVRGEVMLLADGAQVSFVGRAPPASAEHKVKVEVNGKGAYETTLSDAPEASSSPSYRTWLTVDLLSGAKEAQYLYLNELPAGTSVDYAVVRATESTLVTGQLAIVDEVGKAVGFAGWERRAGPVVVQDNTYYPYGGSMHAAKGVGNVMDVSFVGSSISVYGMFPATNGTLSASYTVDAGAPQSRTYEANSSMSTLPNYLLFSQTDLSPGLHTLTLNITENTSDDYLAGGAVSDSGTRTKPLLSKGALAGMIVGVILAVALLVGCVLMRDSLLGRVRGLFTKKNKKCDDTEMRPVNPKIDPWSSQSPHYAFVNPHSGEVDLTKTASTSPGVATRISLDLDKFESLPPSPTPTATAH